MIAAVDEQCASVENDTGEVLTECRLTLDTAFTLGGLASWLTGMILGGSMILEQDDAFVTVVPIGPAPVRDATSGVDATSNLLDRKVDTDAWSSLPSSPGLSIVGRF